MNWRVTVILALSLALALALPRSQRVRREERRPRPGDLVSLFSGVSQGKTQTIPKLDGGAEGVTREGDGSTGTVRVDAQRIIEGEVKVEDNPGLFDSLFKELEIRKERRRQEGSGATASGQTVDGEAPNFGLVDEVRRELGLVDISDVDLELVVQEASEEFFEKCEQFATDLAVCPPKTIHAVNGIEAIGSGLRSICESTRTDSTLKVCETDNTLVNRVEDIFKGLVEERPTAETVDDVLKNLNCYPEAVCRDWAQKAEARKQELTTQVQNAEECQPKLCTVSKDDVPRFISKSRSNGLDDEVMGDTTALISNLGRARVSSEDISDIRSRSSGLTSSDEANMRTMLMEGRPDDVPESARREIARNLMAMVREECEKNAFSPKAPVCTSKDMERGKALEDKKKLLKRKCDSNLSTCGDVDESNLQNKLRERTDLVRSKSRVETERELPNCRPSKLCQDPSRVVADDDDTPYCRPQVCDMTEDELAQFIKKKFNAREKGKGNYRFLNRLHSLRSEADADKIADDIGLDSTNRDTLKKMATGKASEVSEDNKKRLFLALNQEKDKECNAEAPDRDVAEERDIICTREDLMKMKKISKVGSVLKRGCEEKANGNCGTKSDAQANLDKIKASLKNSDLAAALEVSPEQFCFDNEVCDEADEEFANFDAEIFCRHPMCNADERILEKILMRDGSNTGQDGVPIVKSHRKGASFIQTIAFRGDRRDKEIDEFANDEGLSLGEKNDLKSMFNPSRSESQDFSSSERATIDKIFGKIEQECQGVSTAAEPCVDEELVVEEVEGKVSKLVCQDTSLTSCDSQDKEELEATQLLAWEERAKKEALGDASTAANERDFNSPRIGADALDARPQLNCKPAKACEAINSRISHRKFDADQCRPIPCSVAKEDREAFVKKMMSKAKKGKRPSGSTQASAAVACAANAIDDEISRKKLLLEQRRAGRLKWQRVSGDSCSQLDVNNSGLTCSQNDIDNDKEGCIVEGQTELDNICKRNSNAVIKVCFWKTLNDDKTKRWTPRNYRCSVKAEPEL